MNHRGTQKLETERLILRRLTEADAEAMFRNWASDPEVTRFLTWPTHKDVNVTKYVIGTWLPQYEKNDYYHWAVTLKENGDEPIGTIHGLVNEDLEQITVGYCLGRAWWHRGIMSETLQAVIRFFFDQVGANSICSYHDPNNPHSGMVMKHCGMKYEGTRRASDRNNTGICDASWYSIFRKEWKEKTESGQTQLPVSVQEIPLTPEVLETLIRLSEDWEAENSCYGYRKNTSADIEGNRIFVAEDQDGVVGYLFGHVETVEKASSIMPDGTPFFEIEELYVQPERRSKGIGRKLIEYVEEAVSSDAKYILLSTATKNWKAIFHFYLDETGMEFWSARLFKRIR